MLNPDKKPVQKVLPRLDQDCVSRLFDAAEWASDKRAAPLKPVVIGAEYGESACQIVRWVEELGSIGMILDPGDIHDSWLSHRANDLSCLVLDVRACGALDVLASVERFRIAAPQVAVVLISSAVQQADLTRSGVMPDAMLAAPIGRVALKEAILESVALKKSPTPDKWTAGISEFPEGFWK